MSCPNCGSEFTWTKRGPVCPTPGCGEPRYKPLRFRKGKLVVERQAKIVERPPLDLGHEMLMRSETATFAAAVDPYLCVACLDQSIESTHRGAFYHVNEFVNGAVMGDFDANPDSAAQYAGQVVGGLIPAADLRDLVANGYNLATGQVSLGEGLAGVGLSLVGAIPLAGDLLKASGQAARAAKVARATEAAQVRAGVLVFRHRLEPKYARRTIRDFTHADDLVPDIRARLASPAGEKVMPEARRHLEDKLRHFEGVWMRHRAWAGDARGSLVELMNRPNKTAADWAAIHRALGGNLKGDFAELVHVRELLDDAEVRWITHLSPPDKTPGHFDVDLGYVKRLGGEGGEHVFHDQIKTWTERFGPDQMDELRKNLGEMTDHVLKAFNHTGEPVRARFIIEGSPAELTPARVSQIHALIAEHNRRLTFEVARVAPAPPKPAGTFELLLQPVADDAVRRAARQALREAGQRRAAPICKCRFRLVNLAEVFPCSLGPRGRHHWVYSSLYQDSIGTAPTFDCKECPKRMMRGIVHEGLRYWKDEAAMARLRQAHRALNADLMCPRGGAHKWIERVPMTGDLEQMHCEQCGKGHYEERATEGRRRQ
jgi:hypothetical protein